jgi:hypothetical protein
MYKHLFEQSISLPRPPHINCGHSLEIWTLITFIVVAVSLLVFAFFEVVVIKLHLLPPSKNRIKIEVLLLIIGLSIWFWYSATHLVCSPFDRFQKIPTIQ